MVRFIAVFVVVLIGLFGLEMIKPVHELVIEPFAGWLAWVSAAIIIPFDDSILAYGKVLQHGNSGFAVSIESGCNGVEATIVLVAAVIAFPAPWLYRLTAIVLGALAIQFLNIIRIISLFYLGQWDIDMFSWVHLYLWPVLIMLDVLFVFIIYLRFLSSNDAELELET
ncbi:MAG: exosortase H [Halieaceae bacterium]|nr:exosortase H [Halieaceae bacterium]